jgi:hypothetical protein
MRRPLWKSAVFVAVLALLTAGPLACSDDDTGGGGDNPDTGIISDASDGGEDAGPSDSGQDAADTASDASDAGSDASDATDVADTSDTADTAEPVDPGEGHSGCTFPADDDANCDPEDYGDFGPASFLNEFAIQKSGDCCANFDNDTGDDSGLGDLIGFLEDMDLLGVSDFNAEVIAPQIKNGTIVFMFEYAYWSNAVQDPALEMNLIFGQDTDADFAPNLAGTGDFLINPESLDTNGEPKSDFPAARVTNSRLSVSGGSAPMLLPVGADLVETRVDGLQIEADVISGPADLHAGGRVELINGEIAGYVTLEEMFSSLNTVAANCACLSTAPLYVESGQDSWSCRATQADKTACASSSSMCQVLATPNTPPDALQNCSIIKTVVQSNADVNLDDDNAKEALSLGATFEAVGASIVGVGSTP